MNKDTCSVCTCGHAVYAHQHWGSIPSENSYLCVDCGYNNKIPFKNAWHKFKLDNLKYLEGMTNEQS